MTLSRATCFLALSGFVASSSAACGSSEVPTFPAMPTTPNGAEVSSPSPCLDVLALQNPRAFSLGETFYLPASSHLEGCPENPAWELIRGPQGSQSAVYGEGAPFPRVTPDLAGTYEFRAKNLENATLALTVVARSNRDRFQNFYLTPMFGASNVGDEVWVANGAAYSVSRLAKVDGQWAKVGETPVGSWPGAVAWRDPLPFAVVAQRGSDSVGFVDRAQGSLTDALWVGDEPTGLAISPDGKTLYVSLATERAIAIVNLDTRVVEGRIGVGFDPRALALSSDGRQLYVASYRSGNLQNGPGSSRSPEQDQDLFVIDTQTRNVVRTVASVSADLRALSLAPEGDELFVAATDGDTLPPQSDPAAKSFVHEVVVVNTKVDSPSFGTLARRVDLSRQTTSKGPAVNPSGVWASASTVVVANESNNQVVGLDRNTLEERFRVTVGDGPRQIIPLDDGIAVHCFQSFELWILSAEGTVRQVVSLAEDPRPKAVAIGERVFTRPGNGFAANHACSSCHIESQNDGMIWRFGPQIWHNVRPLQLLASTTPLEWGAYLSSSANFGHAGPSSIVGRPATTEEADGLGAFLDSLLGAPRATGTTRLDGSFTKQGLEGKAAFEKGGCTGCHTPPLYTNRTLIPKGKSGEAADVPSLLGVYRHGAFMVNGKTHTLRDAVEVAANYLGGAMPATDRDAVARFLSELTPKGAAPLAIFPDIDSTMANLPTVTPWVEFSEPVDDTQGGADSLASRFVRLETRDGQRTDVAVQVEGNRILVKPKAALTPGGAYLLRVQSGLPFRSGGQLEADRVSEFRIAEKPAAATLSKDLELTVTVPSRQPDGSSKETTLRYPVAFQSSPTTDSMWTMTVSPTATQTRWIRFDGSRVFVQPFALPLGRTIANASSVEGDVQPDGSIRGTLEVGAPGLRWPGIVWQLTAKAPAPSP